MSLEELQARRRKLQENSDITLRNMEKIANESLRVAEVAHNAPQILDDLDKEFESITGLDSKDIKFLFAATGLQLARIYIANELTKIEKAGKGELEKDLKDWQKKKLGKIDPGDSLVDLPYYASLNHIITKPGVPYDTQETLTEKSLASKLKSKSKSLSWSFDLEDYISENNIPYFKGADHRFSTLGHDPLIGLIVGTANIMTNTITFVTSPLDIVSLGVPMLATHHVIHTSNYSHAMIGTPASTIEMFSKVAERTMEEPEALAAALIKQIIHIGTDMYTPCGIQIPAASLVLTNTKAQKLTEKISWGDIAKVGTSAAIASLINAMISMLHKLTHDMRDGVSEEVYEVKTRKIIMMSNTIATGSNVLWQGGKAYVTKDLSQLRNLDFGGLIVLLKRLREDKEFIRQIKEEYIFEKFNNMILGEDLQLEEIKE